MSDEPDVRVMLVKAALDGVRACAAPKTDGAYPIVEKIVAQDDHSFTVTLGDGTEIHFSTIVI